jgi:hypothetical protein
MTMPQSSIWLSGRGRQNRHPMPGTGEGVWRAGPAHRGVRLPNAVLVGKCAA